MVRPILLLASLLSPIAAADSKLVLCCSAENDLYLALGGRQSPIVRCDTPLEAVTRAPHGGAILVLADGYPATRTKLGEAFFTAAEKKSLRLYIEFPEAVPGVEFGEPRTAGWERVVVAADGLGKPLNKLRILNAHACSYLPTKAGEPALVLGRVAGFDTAVYGLPKQQSPVLFPMREGRWWVATTKLSNFVTGRYETPEDWAAVWRFLLARVDPEGRHELRWQPVARPAYGRDEALTPIAEVEACRSAAAWYLNSGLLVGADGEAEIHRLLARGAEQLDPPTTGGTKADGRRGVLEGFASQIMPDGAQPRRLPIRADCNAESAMVLALEAWRVTGGADAASPARAREVAVNLLGYVYRGAPSWRGPRGDPRHPAFGLIAWGEVAPAWVVGNYGDDNARAILATISAAAALHSDAYDRPVLRALLANLRTTGRLGFRGDRVDVPALERFGWQHFHDAATVNDSPHFESGLWACYLWAHARTGEAEFLETAKKGIAALMAKYPDGWRLSDNLERARMLLCLAWLVRVEDTAEHRRWLDVVAADLLKSQRPASGALRERLGGAGRGHYRVPQSNEAYGTTETPLQQAPDDPVTDQLYTTGFALLGLHEAAAATSDAKLRRAEDALARYLCRIQIRSERRPELDGGWFRAFDDAAWAYRASSADIGWGAWCVEAGWGQAWTAATLALRQKGMTLWELTAASAIARQMEAVKAEMAKNDGGPWKP
jgi:hypothetical protein